jgi:hypothetical protein
MDERTSLLQEICKCVAIKSFLPSRVSIFVVKILWMGLRESMSVNPSPSLTVCTLCVAPYPYNGRHSIDSLRNGKDDRCWSEIV